MKYQRHHLILKLIEDECIETQTELTERLKKAGFDVTQATISRDIKELRLVKVHDHDEHYRYSVSGGEGGADFNSRFRNIFRESVVNIDFAGNMVVIKTLPGVASASAAAIDAMKVPSIVGSLAGDDTLFLVMRSQNKAAEFCSEIKNMLK